MLLVAAVCLPKSFAFGGVSRLIPQRVRAPLVFPSSAKPAEMEDCNGGVCNRKGDSGEAGAARRLVGDSGEAGAALRGGGGPSVVFDVYSDPA